MAVDNSVDPAGWFAEQIGACEPDLLRQMVKTMAEALMSAEADSYTTPLDVTDVNRLEHRGR